MLVAAAMILPACAVPESEVDSAEDIRENVTIGEVSEEFTEYAGEMISVRSEVSELVGDSAFFLDEDQLFGGEELLVINTSNSAIELVEGDDTEVQVTGEVRQLVRADLEREFDLDLDPDLFVDFEGQPVVLASSIALSPDPSDISDAPELYYNRRIAVSGEVEEIFSLMAISLDDDTLFGGEDLLVIDPQGSLIADEGEEVVVTGVLRPFVMAEFEEDYDLTWDLDMQRQIEAEYENRPVFVADEIYPSAM
ncbi:MAG: hypothetical protein HC838_17225 [Spirulinaceae cyanobacterium RM2_2_10]|nr:hypothetical protein [Spirulinaceae cyanobacterium SM2_1_0]NJO21427.1 hypothetical protein [Spirulinaceae cyanobacterium RM2_2_10]